MPWKLRIALLLNYPAVIITFIVKLSAHTTIPVAQSVVLVACTFFDRLQSGCQGRMDNGSGMMEEYTIIATVP